MIHSTEEWQLVLEDLCTPKEIEDLADRWTVARLLAKGTFSYRDINKLTGVSLTTIGRVARTLNDSTKNGYKILLQRTNKNEKNIT